MVYLKTDIMKDSLKPVKKIPWCHQTIQTEWSFLPSNKLKLNDTEFMPKDLFRDNENEDRIGIMILGHYKINFNQLVEEYCLDHELGNFSRFKKQKVTKKKNPEDHDDETKDQEGTVKPKPTLIEV
jgi:hypothetical protein